MQASLSFPSSGDNSLLVNEAKDWPSVSSLYETTHPIYQQIVKYSIVHLVFTLNWVTPPPWKWRAV